MATNVFQLLQAEIIDNVTLNDLIPQLNGESLLTQSEEERLTNSSVTEYDRKLELTSILRRKGPDAPSLFVTCLRRRGTTGHLYLAEFIERHIAGRGRGPGFYGVAVDHGVQGSTARPSSQPLHCSPQLAHQSNPVELLNAAAVQSDSNSQQPCRESQNLTAHTATAHDSSSSSADMLSDTSSSPEAFPFSNSFEEHRRPDTVSDRYHDMISMISTALILPSRSVSFTAIKNALRASLQSSGINLALPDNIYDVRALLDWLCEQRMCHEYDVDLLCEILKRLNQHDLHQEVLAYTQSIMHDNILDYTSSAPNPMPGHFLTFTTHNCPSLTYAQVCEVKDVLSDLLDLDRHTFWLSSSEQGSVILGWGFRMEVAKRCISVLEDASVHDELLSRSKMHNVTLVETLSHGGTERHIAFSSLRSSSGQPLSSAATPGIEPPSTLEPSLSQWEESEVSSSTAGTSGHPLPMDVSQYTSEPPRLIGAEDVSAADSTQPDTVSDVETDGTKRPTRIGQKRKNTSSASQPLPKRKALSTGSEGVHLMGMSPRQFSEQYITPSFQKTESETLYRRVLMENQSYIIRNLNLMSILPHLNALSLLTEAENEEMQLRVPEYDKIVKLVTILAKKGEEGFHRFLAALERASDHLTHSVIAETLKQSLRRLPKPAQTLSLDMPQVLINHLRDWYNNPQFYYGSAGPHIRDVKFIRLALVMKQGIREEDKWKDKFLRATLHGHVEDIMKRKKQLEMNGIFQYGKTPRKLVLVEGAPGVGKTMLAMKLCVDWAHGRALGEYEVVLFVELRRFQGESKLKLETVLGTYLEEDEELTKQAVQYFIRTGGRRLLIILEGWDELSPQLRQRYSLFFDLIEGKKLPNASIMVTSRPSVTAPLYDFMDERRVEVLGFDEKQQNEYIDKNVSDRRVAQRVRDHLKQFPNLRALAHIPLTLAIICSVATETESLPITLTELYDRDTCRLLFQNLQKSPKESLNSLIGLESLDLIPDEVRELFLALCKLALHGFKQRAFIFKSRDLEEFGLPSVPGFDGFGLLTTTFRSTTAGKKILYQFRHLSIQEYLAGLETSRLPREERSSLLAEFRTDKQFRNIWKFLAGITKLHDKAFCHEIVNPTRPSSRDQLFLLHCLYEAQNPEICQAAADRIERTLHLDNTTLNATDCMCAAYMMGSAEGDWQVNLRGCNIGGDGLEVFKWQLRAHDSPHLRITLLDLTHNQLDASAMTHVSEILLELETKVLRLKIESNKIGDDGVRELSRALKQNKTALLQLMFRGCGLTSESVRWFAEALKVNTTFNNVYFGFDELSDRGVQYISEALIDNTTLEELGLAKVGLTSVGLRHLSNALKTNHTLKYLRIDRNNLGPSECLIVAELLRTHESLDLLDVSKNPIGDDGLAAIMEALIEKPDALKKLGVYGCAFTSRNMHMFVDLFKKTTVFKGMHIGLNPIGDVGAEQIVRAVKENISGSVKEIFLENTGLTEKGKQLITEASQLRTDLIVSDVANAIVERTRERIKEDLRSK